MTFHQYWMKKRRTARRYCARFWQNALTSSLQDFEFGAMQKSTNRVEYYLLKSWEICNFSLRSAFVRPRYGLQKLVNWRRSKGQSRTSTTESAVLSPSPASEFLESTIRTSTSQLFSFYFFLPKESEGQWIRSWCWASFEASSKATHAACAASSTACCAARFYPFRCIQQFL